MLTSQVTKWRLMIKKKKEENKKTYSRCIYFGGCYYGNFPNIELRFDMWSVFSLPLSLLKMSVSFRCYCFVPNSVKLCFLQQSFEWIIRDINENMSNPRSLLNHFSCICLNVSRLSSLALGFSNIPKKENVVGRFSRK